VTFIKELELKPGCRILVSKRNMIIPHVEDNLDRDGYDASILPLYCPCCNGIAKLRVSGDGRGRETLTLRCDNPDCASQKLRKFVHFAGKKAMDIEGLSETTLAKFITKGWLDDFTDIYRIDRHAEEITKMEGFGQLSWGKLWKAIEKSRNTTFERFVIAMDIPMVGNTASRELSRMFGGSLDNLAEAVEANFDFSILNGFGETLYRNIRQWFTEADNKRLWKEMRKMVNVETKTKSAANTGNIFAGRTIVVTGTLENFTRNSINEKIESLGARAGSAVSSKTDYLIAGEKAGSKLAKARTLGITVLTEREFLDMAASA
jgi:DNA ligase (NAD+)